MVRERLLFRGHSLIDQVHWWHLLLSNDLMINDQDRVPRLSLLRQLLTLIRVHTLSHLLKSHRRLIDR